MAKYQKDACVVPVDRLQIAGCVRSNAKAFPSILRTELLLRAARDRCARYARDTMETRFQSRIRSIFSLLFFYR